MKTRLFTIKKISGLILFLTIIAAGLMIPAQTHAACKAGFIDSVSGKSVKFYNNSSAVNSSYKVKWYFGDGSTSDSKNPITHVYADYNKKYQVCLYIYDSVANCRDSFCTTVTTGPSPCIASYSYVLVSGGKISFKNTSSSGSGSFTSSWDFGDSTTSTDASPTHTFKSSGKYQVCLTITDSSGSCKNTYCSYVSVCTSISSFTYTQSGYKVSFSSNSTTSAHTQYTWYFGDGTRDSTSGKSATHTYSTGTSVTAYLIISDSTSKCSSYSFQTISFCSLSNLWTYSTSLLKASFSCPNNGASVKYKWDFGDKTTSTSQNPTHSFSVSGTYNVCLTVTDTSTGCNVTRCLNVSVTSCNLKDSFSYAASSRTVTFTGYASSTAHLQYKWIFGDGSANDSTSGKTAKHTYSGTATTYKVYLLVYDSTTKCSAYYYNIISICYVSANFNVGATALTIKCSSDSTNPKSVKYTWDFGDKTSSLDANPHHTYTTSGTYTVCLTAKDTSTGCTNSECKSITINACSIYANYYDTVKGRTIYFYGFTNASKHSRYTWYFGDGTIDSTSNNLVTHHTYGSSSSSASVYLKVYDSTTKCIVYASHSITLCPASSIYTFSVNKYTAEFHPDSTNSSHIKYKWDFGDHSSSLDANPKHIFTYNGNYTVCLTATDSSTGCYTTTCKTVAINNCSLKASFSYLLNGRKVKFSGTSSATSHISVIWFFGDGSVDSSSNSIYVSHTYSSSIYSAHVYMRVYDSTTKCLVYADHNISFCSVSGHFTYAASGTGVKFVSDSTNSSTTKYYWSFGDKTTSHDKNPGHTFSSSGTYHVCLYVSDSPCTASYCDSIKVSGSTSTFCIHGTVYMGTKSGYPCKVYLITFNPKDSSLSAVDSVEIKDTTGKYEFCGLKNGTYYTKAALTKSNKYYKYYIPTYHVDAIKWAHAQKIVIYNANVTGADIKMKLGTNPGGPGFVAGKIKAGANKTGDPQSGILVIIYDENDNPVAYTYTDATGEYSFSGLAFGAYTIEGEIPGKVCYPAYVVLTDSNATFTNIDLEVNTTTITAAIKPVEHWIFEHTNVYPNPVSDKLYIATNLAHSQNVTITVYDVTGKIVTHVNTSIDAGDQNTTVDASALPQGMYFLRVQLSKDNKMLEARFMKVH